MAEGKGGAGFPTIDDLDRAGQLRDKRVLVRADLNVPMKDGRVTDATRIERLVPTVKALHDKGAAVILLSHFGRPKGRPVPEMSLRPLVAPLAECLNTGVSFAPDCQGEAAETAAAGLMPGGVLLLENLRFHAGEEANDPTFAAGLAVLGDAYVNDAFSCAHRAHASVEAICHRLPKAAGLAMQAELEALTAALEKPERPVGAVVGGAKVSTKLDLLGNLVGKVDLLVVGGGMANTFLHAQGVAVGKSLCEPDMADTARAIFDKAKAAGCEILLPTDAVIAAEFAAGAASTVVPVDAVPDDRMILDVGPETAELLAKRLGELKTLVWNGPLGAFEVPPFDAGTVAVAKAAADLTEAGRLRTVAGGGDTVAALNHAGVGGRFTYVSTAGGAFLEWLEGKTLPGVAALML